MNELIVCAVAVTVSQTAFAAQRPKGGDIKWADETATEIETAA